jgi:hypothetical protein
MVNRCEREHLQKSVINDMNQNITVEITERLKTVKPHSGTPFASHRREVFYFKTADWIYAVSCHNIMLGIYRIHRSTFWTDSSGVAVFRSGKKMTTEMYDVMPVSSATKTELKYCDSYNNHIAKRTGVSHTRLVCPFKIGTCDYLDHLIKNLTDTDHATVIAPDPDFQSDEEIVAPPIIVESVAPPAVVVPVEPPVLKKSHKKKSSVVAEVPQPAVVVPPPAVVEPIIAVAKKSHHKKKQPNI